jgi:hypothetical protein
VKETNQTVTQMRIEQAGLKVKVSLIASTVGAFVGAIVSAWIGKR